MLSVTILISVRRRLHVQALSAERSSLHPSRYKGIIQLLSIMAWSLVCPASRGIGFQLTRHLLRTTKIPVIATARKDVTGVKKSILEDLPDVDPKRLEVLEVDVTSIFHPLSNFIPGPKKSFMV